MAKAVATAASTALLPLRRMSQPTSDPGGETATTMPCLAETGCSPAKVGGRKRRVESEKRKATLGARIRGVSLGRVRVGMAASDIERRRGMWVQRQVC